MSDETKSDPAVEAPLSKPEEEPRNSAALASELGPMSTPGDVAAYAVRACAEGKPVSSILVTLRVAKVPPVRPPVWRSSDVFKILDDNGAKPPVSFFPPPPPKKGEE